jgi:hypothetical protein
LFLDPLFLNLNIFDEHLQNHIKDEFRPSLATPILFLVDVRGDVPYFYDTFPVQIEDAVATPDQASAVPWWSAALAHTNAYDPMTPHPSAHISPPHHG